MHTIIVTYDLRGAETSSEYERLIDEIKLYKTVLKPLYSVWLIRTEWSATQVRDDLIRWIDSDDRLLVWDVTGKEAAWSAVVNRESGDWIKNTP